MSENRGFFWEKLEPFIGRKDIVSQYIQKLKEGDFSFEAITASYGYGKTRLLKQILKTARKQCRDFAIPRQEIDLYHTENHSPEGLAASIVQSLREYDFYFSGRFSRYDELKHKREESRLVGNTRDVQRYTEEMLDECKKALCLLSEERRLLLLFDTGERWIYPEIAGAPFVTNIAPAWLWLKELCEQLPKGLVILAGRDEIKSLGFKSEQITELGLFSPSETHDYVSVVAKLYRKKHQKSFETFSSTEIDRLHKVSKGRPILLAMFLQLVAGGNQSIRSEIDNLSADALEPAIVRHLMDDPNVNLFLRFIGRAPKGVDKKLLIEMTGLDEIRIDVAIQNLKQLSFVKTFSGSDKLFLHDEMYNILERNIYIPTSNSGDNLEQDSAFQGIYKYYKMRTNEKYRTIGDLYIQYTTIDKSREKRKIWNKIDIAQRELRNLNIDFAFYRWLRSAKRGEDAIEMGLRRYYRIAHEAALNSDAETLLLLRFEIINFIKNIEKQTDISSSQWRSFLRGFLFLQNVWEIYATGQTSDLPVKIENIFLPNIEYLEGLSSEQKILLSGLLSIWRGICLLYSTKPDYPTADQIFESSITNLKSLFHHPSLWWFARTSIALAYRQRAYMYKRQGSFDDASNYYAEAANINRNLDFKFEEAIIRNDWGDTQIILGSLDDGYLNLQDALNLRCNMASGAHIALSYSTLSRYYFARGAFADARAYAQRGMNISPRSTALSKISLAEAERRYVTEEFNGPTEKKIALLKNAERALFDALDGLTEPVRLVDAKLELGCLYRDLLRFIENDQAREEYIKKSEELLTESAKLAFSQKPPIYWRIADAMANRIWLGLFAQNEDMARCAAEEFAQLNIFGFDIDKKGNFIEAVKILSNSQKRPLLQFIGKYHVGLGTLLLGKEKKPEKERMGAIAWHWMLGLEYSAKFANSYRGLESARKTIDKKIRTFNQDEELLWLSREIKNAENQEKIKESFLKRMMKKNSFWVEDD